MNGHFKNEQQIENLVAGFLNLTLPLKEWTHEAHLTVATYLLNKFSVEEATCILRAGIFTFNKSVGVVNTPAKGYHETLTLFWIKTISQYLKENGKDNKLMLCNNFIRSEYGSRHYALNFYSREALFSTKARAFWIRPDKENIPWPGE